MKKLKIFILVSVITFFLVLIVKAFENPRQNPPLGGGALQIQSNQLLITKSTKVTGTSTFIVEGGNVGIGTTAPTQGKLVVSGGSIAADFSNYAFVDLGASNRFRICGPSGSCSTAGEFIGGRIRLSGDGSFANAQAQVDPGMGGINAPGNVYIGGNVGIGTTNPGYKLDVIGFVRGSQGLCIGNECRTSWPEGGEGGEGGIGGSGTTNYIAKFTASTTIGNSQIYDNGTNVGIGTTAPAQKLHVVGNAAITGNVGIGTTAPNYKLDVNGSIRASGTSSIPMACRATTTEEMNNQPRCESYEWELAAWCSGDCSPDDAKVTICCRRY